MFLSETALKPGEQSQNLPLTERQTNKDRRLVIQ